MLGTMWRQRVVLLLLWLEEKGLGGLVQERKNTAWESVFVLTDGEGVKGLLRGLESCALFGSHVSQTLHVRHGRIWL